MIIIFDTETNGLPKNWKAKCTDVNNWPRICQLAWELRTNEGELLHKDCILIRPENWEIPKEKFWIDNGFSTEKSLAEGEWLSSAIFKFRASLNAASIIVAHNINFDMPILQAELIRLGIDHILPHEQICTMNASTDLCQIPGPYGFKWPKLEELYRWLFNEEMKGAHDAGWDVEACANCYFELDRRGLLPQRRVGDITYSDIVRYDNMPAPNYFGLPGKSHSFLKRETNGVVPEFVETPKIIIGKLVDAILTDPNNVDTSNQYFSIAREIAIHIKNTFGDLIKRFKRQVSYTAKLSYNGLVMHSQGRLDWLLERHAVLDLKITEATNLDELVKFMRYDNQGWHYCKMAGVTKFYIIAYSTKLGKCFPPYYIDCSSNYNEFWAKGILKHGSVENIRIDNQ